MGKQFPLIHFWKEGEYVPFSSGSYNPVCGDNSQRNKHACQLTEIILL